MQSSENDNCVGIIIKEVKVNDVDCKMKSDEDLDIIAILENEKKCNCITGSVKHKLEEFYNVLEQKCCIIYKTMKRLN